MTLVECYKEMIIIWNQLANNPTLNKLDIHESSKYDSRCPACEYCKEKKTTQPCYDICPMKSLWDKGCGEPLSAYKKWELNKGYDRQFFAAIIVEEAKLLLEKEEKR